MSPTRDWNLQPPTGSWVGKGGSASVAGPVSQRERAHTCTCVRCITNLAERKAWLWTRNMAGDGAPLRQRGGIMRQVRIFGEGLTAGSSPPPLSRCAQNSGTISLSFPRFFLPLSLSLHLPLSLAPPDSYLSPRCHVLPSKSRFARLRSRLGVPARIPARSPRSSPAGRLPVSVLRLVESEAFLHISG